MFVGYHRFQPTFSSIHGTNRQSLVMDEILAQSMSLGYVAVDEKGTSKTEKKNEYFELAG
jgi:hypothetical protein